MLNKGIKEEKLSNKLYNQSNAEREEKSYFLFIHILFFRVHYNVRNSSLVVVDFVVSCDLQTQKNIEKHEEIFSFSLGISENKLNFVCLHSIIFPRLSPYFFSP